MLDGNSPGRLTNMVPANLSRPSLKYFARLQNGKTPTIFLLSFHFSSQFSPLIFHWPRIWCWVSEKEDNFIHSSCSSQKKAGFHQIDKININVSYINLIYDTYTKTLMSMFILPFYQIFIHMPVHLFMFLMLNANVLQLFYQINMKNMSKSLSYVHIITVHLFMFSRVLFWRSMRAFCSLFIHINATAIHTIFA